MERKGSIADRTWPDGQLFYIQDGRQVVGNCIALWRVDGQGYTCDLKEAWRVPYDKAITIEGNRSTEILWPCEELDRISKIHVDIQYLRRLQEGAAPETYYPNLADGL